MAWYDEDSWLTAAFSPNLSTILIALALYYPGQQGTQVWQTLVEHARVLVLEDATRKVVGVLSGGRMSHFTTGLPNLHGECLEISLHLLCRAMDIRVARQACCCDGLMLLLGCLC